MKKLCSQYSYAILLIFLSCAFALILSFKFESPNHESYIKITVSEGDSLWDLANQYASEHSLSDSEFINWVQQQNDIEGDIIYPGDELLIPIDHRSFSTTQLASAPGE